MINLVFSQDEKWKEAKDFIREQGQDGNWIEVVDYYRQIGGKHVAVFVAIDRVQYRILEATTDNKVVLIDANDTIHLMDYNLVMESRKTFYYIEHPKHQEVKIEPEISKVLYNTTDKLTLSK